MEIKNMASSPHSCKHGSVLCDNLLNHESNCSSSSSSSFSSKTSDTGHHSEHSLSWSCTPEEANQEDCDIDSSVNTSITHQPNKVIEDEMESSTHRQQPHQHEATRLVQQTENPHCANADAENRNPSILNDDEDNTVCHHDQEEDMSNNKIGIERRRSFATPVLMNSFRLQNLRDQQQSNNQVHWAIGMVYAWIRHWYQSWESMAYTFPLWIWPMIVFLTLVQPMSTLVVLPVVVLVLRYGRQMASGFQVPTPSKVIRLWKWIGHTVRDRWNRLLGRARLRGRGILVFLAVMLRTLQRDSRKRKM